jgi:hypothetical protein
MQSAFQPWVLGLTIMQQSVLASAVRGPDGIRKDHPAKVFMRWYRRCVMVSAFDRRSLTDPLEPGGGSFTGPLPSVVDPPHYDDRAPDATNDRWLKEWHDRAVPAALASAKEGLFRSIDELPHHFWLHIVHAAQIIGFKHPEPWIRTFWIELYEHACMDMHMYGESEEMMDDRLGDTEAGWRAREATPAR